jgi:hypothetical protein
MNLRMSASCEVELGLAEGATKVNVCPVQGGELLAACAGEQAEEVATTQRADYEDYWV